jgi:glycolate oxidase FAD binding subunit
MMDAVLASLTDQIKAAATAATPLRIRAGGTKDFYGNASDEGAILDPRPLRGIVSYEPTELVVTVRAGTPLAELEDELADSGQMLPFEPPHFDIKGADDATIGGAVASGLAGPRRASYGPTYGGVRDFVLGATLLDGRGQLLRFGGTVMKNVAGYDMARALAGSLGILGVLTDLSIKVLPRPVTETTVRMHMSQEEALDRLNAWGGQPLPVSATAWVDDLLYLRLSGAAAAVDAAALRMKIDHDADVLDEEGADALWRGVRDQRHRFFSPDDLEPFPLWRLSLPSTAAPARLPGTQLIEWGGALRWLRSEASPDEIRLHAAALGGHATLFRGGSPQVREAGAFTPLAVPIARMHQRLKAEFDPAGIFNRGRMYAEF